ncbi:MAG TPA: hypothetical protein VD994_20035 [Prosthecobacter sp.]|nr:hypothetical protein [Prosthecobacter sp.]
MDRTEKTTLEKIITAYFNVESDNIDDLATWVKHTHLPSATSEIAEFKTQLREALDRPGIITPEIYERCTDNDEFETQDGIQARLQMTWDACFG